MKTVFLASSSQDGRLRIVRPEYQGPCYLILHVPDYVTPVDVQVLASNTVFLKDGLYSYGALGAGRIAYPITEESIRQIIDGEDSLQPNEVIEAVIESLGRRRTKS